MRSLRGSRLAMCLLAGSGLLLPASAMAQEPGTGQQQPNAGQQPSVQQTPNPGRAANAAAEPSARQRRNAEKYYAQGVKATAKGDVPAADRAFAKAARSDPNNHDYAVDAQIAQQHSITKLIQDADKARLLGHPEQVHAKLSEALALDPRNPVVSQHINDLADLAAAEPHEDRLSLELAPPVELTPHPGLQSFHLKGTKQDVLRRVLTAYGVGITADESLGNEMVHFDVDNIDYAHAADLAGLATDSFLVPLDPVRVLAAKDTKENHQKFDRLAVETIFLPGLTPTEYTDMSNLAKNVLGVQQSSAQPNQGTLTVRAPVQTLVALNKTFADLLDGKSEVLLDVKIYEVDDTRTRVYGIQPPQTTTVFNLSSQLNGIISGNSSLVQQIISSGLASAGDYAAIAAILIASGEVTSSLLSSPFATFGNGLTLTGLQTNGISGNLTLNTTNDRSLDELQLRLDDNAEGTIRSGTRYPITTSSYSSISASSVSIPGITSAGLSSVLSGLGVSASSLSSIAPIPQVQYQDLGLTLKATPRIDRNDDVVLKLDLKIDALEGTSLNGLPLLTNRSYTADIRLRNGASALVVGDLSRQESNAISGTPGLSELPGFASLSNTTREYDVSNLAILITPHILRRRHTELVGPQIPLPHHI